MTRLGVMVVLSLVAMGCGSDGGGDPTGGGSAGATAPPAATAASGDADAGAGSGDQGGGASVVDSSGSVAAPCSVLTEQEVADATGLVVTGSEDRGAEGCRWYVERVDPDIVADDAISWQPFRAEQFGSQKDALEQGLEGEQIEGLGNDALFVGPATIGEVWVLLDDLSFRVGNQFAFGNLDGRPAQEALARALVDALG